MIKFFRKIRYDLMDKNKTGKYLKYAIGEIVLVVIGILIALQVNNANELSKQNKLLKAYENSLISELRNDLSNIKRYDSIYNIIRTKNLDYLDYYRKQNKDITVLNQKMDSIKNTAMSKLPSSTLTIDDLISTGNLTLFSKEKKEAILRVKNVHEFYGQTYVQEIQKWNLSLIEFQNSIDQILFMNLFIDNLNSQKTRIEDWRFDLKSEQFKLFGNKTYATLEICDFQLGLFLPIKIHSEYLLNILEKKNNK